MKKKTQNRRDFLKITGTSIAGIIVATSGITIISAESQLLTNQPSFELWLLKTGEDNLPKDIYRSVLSEME